MFIDKETGIQYVDHWNVRAYLDVCKKFGLEPLFALDYSKPIKEIASLFETGIFSAAIVLGDELSFEEMQYTKDRISSHLNVLHVLYKAINVDDPSVQFLVEINPANVCKPLQKIAYDPDSGNVLQIKGRYKFEPYSEKYPNEVEEFVRKMRLYYCSG